MLYLHIRERGAKAGVIISPVKNRCCGAMLVREDLHKIKL